MMSKMGSIALAICTFAAIFIVLATAKRTSTTTTIIIDNPSPSSDVSSSEATNRIKPQPIVVPPTVQEGIQIPEPRVPQLDLGQNLSVPDGTYLQLWECDGSWNQELILNPTDGGIHLKASAQKCLDVSGYNTNNGSYVWLWDCHLNVKGSNQIWLYDEPTQRIMSNLTSDFCLTATYPAITMWTCDHQLPQRWIIDSKTSTIRPAFNKSMCLDIGSSYNCSSPQLKKLPFCNTDLAPNVRAADLISRMNLEDKISQMGTSTVGISSLSVPAYNYWTESLHGVVSAAVATSFPQVIGLGATFNMTGVKAMAKIVSTEARAIHNEGLAGLTYFAPNINIFRDPRWGRGQETPGEDPYLTGRYAVAYVTGMQEGEDPRCLKVIATCKHFDAYSLELWNGVDRHHFNAIVDDKDLAETYLPAFEACVTEGRAQSIMCSYNAVNGVPSCANDFLLNQIARDAWGFDGFVVSDCGAIDDILYTHKYTNTTSETCAAALYGGCDLDCGNFYQQNLFDAVKDGAVSEKDIDKSLQRMFSQRFRLGMWDTPATCSYNSLKYATSVNTPEAQQLALDLARQSIVLLKNDNKILPLDTTKIKAVAVIGPQANDPSLLLGNYYGKPPYIITPLEAIKNRGDVDVFYSQGCSVTGNDTSGFEDALGAAALADVAIVFVGLNQQIEEEGRDRYELTLPGVQEQLIQLIRNKTKTPVVVVLINGGPVAIEWIDENIDGIIEAFYPGQSGGQAIADVLFGDYNPGGKLPYTVYRSDYVNQISMFNMNMRQYPGRTYRYLQVEPLYEFGYGLSYTTFNTKWTNGSDTLAVIGPMESAMFEAVVTNTGHLAGDEVVLAFFSKEGNSCVGDAPKKQLFGFERVHLKPGQSKTVWFTLPPQMMAQVDKRGKKLICPGDYKVTLGVGDAADSRVLHVASAAPVYIG